MNINDLTIGQAKELARLVNPTAAPQGCNDMLGTKCIVRTYSAGVWYGTVEKKSGAEVIIKDARRLWSWHAKQGISLSAVATYGLNHDKSTIPAAIPQVWLEAIELIPCSPDATRSIEDAPEAAAR